MIEDIEYQRPSNLDEVVALLATGPEPTILAGGTDVMVWMHGGGFTPERIVDISGIRPACTQIAEDGETIRIGPLLTHTQVAQSELLQRELPLLAAASDSIGAPPIRNRGTLGGNIGGSSPAGDILPVLMAYDATIVLRSAGGERSIPYRQYCTGYRCTARRADELITEIQIPKADPEAVQRWYKIGGRAAQACSKLNLAALGLVEEDEIVELSLAAGSVSEKPVMLEATQSLLLGEFLDSAIPSQVRQAVASDISPIDDLRSTASYRKLVMENLVLRFLSELKEVYF